MVERVDLAIAKTGECVKSMGRPVGVMRHLQLGEANMPSTSAPVDTFLAPVAPFRNTISGTNLPLARVAIPRISLAHALPN